MKKIKVILLMGIAVGAISLLLGYSLVQYQLNEPYYGNVTPPLIEIPYGMESAKIAALLREKGVIRSRVACLIYIRFTNFETHLRAGSFLFPKGMTLVSVIDNLVNENGAARLIRVTIPEGYTIWDIGNVLEAKNLVSSRLFVEYAHHKARYDFEEEFPFLKDVPGDTLEGYLYPETYLFSPGSPPKVIIRVLLKQFSKTVIPVWTNVKREQQLKDEVLSLHQTLTLASLIEKEAMKRSEMPLISSVFYNRLRKKMKLASDPTVVYALGQSHKDKVLYKDLKVDSPYNTYKYKGLPPAPISSVSLSSFYAALLPEKTPFIFFVANQDGTHAFTRTYQEHLHAQKVKF